jgi:hypothetical protein
MNYIVVALLLGVASVATPVLAEDAAPAAAAAKVLFTTAESTIGDILDNPEAKAIVDKHLPGLSTNEQIDMARGFSLKAVQSFKPDLISDETLAKIDADFAALAAAN